MRTSVWITIFTIVATARLSACSPDPIAPPAPSSETAVATLTLDASIQDLISINTIDQVELLYTLNGHSRRVLQVAFSENGALVASSSEDMKIKLWDVQSGHEIHTFHMTSIDMMDITFSPDGNLLASGEAIWDLESKKELHTIERGSHLPASVAFSPDGSFLAVALFDQPIKLWDVSSGQVAISFEEHADNRAVHIEFSPDGTLLAAGLKDGTVRLWDVSSREVIQTFRYSGESDIHDIAFSPDSRFLASGGRVPSVRVWDVASGELVSTLGLREGLMSVDFSPDGTILASTGGIEHTVRLWDLEGRTLLRSLQHNDQLMKVVFSPDGKLLATGGHDNQVYLWGISTEP